MPIACDVFVIIIELTPTISRCEKAFAGRAIREQHLVLIELDVKILEPISPRAYSPDGSPVDQIAHRHQHAVQIEHVPGREIKVS